MVVKQVIAGCFVLPLLLLVHTTGTGCAGTGSSAAVSGNKPFLLAEERRIALYGPAGSQDFLHVSWRAGRSDGTLFPVPDADLLDSDMPQPMWRILPDGLGEVFIPRGNWRVPADCSHIVYRVSLCRYGLNSAVNKPRDASTFSVKIADPHDGVWSDLRDK